MLNILCILWLSGKDGTSTQQLYRTSIKHVTSDLIEVQIVTAFYEVTPYNLVDKRPSKVLGTVLSPTSEEGRSRFLPNVDTCKPNYTTSHHQKTVIIGS